MKIRIKKIEYCSIKEISLKKEGGKSEKSIFDPSNGGIGTKLNIASPKLTTMI